ncbi:hypothetical protein K470DRAFT_135268 [Piedraia hortae CBS 480.64]|uniref:Uncharacterized protein n=1 Tax=Piedraia hortae CBS 480.64 TaxID=1314780 RepID=A0A6A7BSX6_9PEZI|nr:hypothetical protein K470DRAFT_135268 [Piedraia hortae CBS 480.64]
MLYMDESGQFDMFGSIEEYFIDHAAHIFQICLTRTTSCSCMHCPQESATDNKQTKGIAIVSGGSILRVDQQAIRIVLSGSLAYCRMKIDFSQNLPTTSFK